jgi:hypothetical protein
MWRIHTSRIALDYFIKTCSNESSLALMGASLAKLPMQSLRMIKFQSSRASLMDQHKKSAKEAIRLFQHEKLLHTNTKKVSFLCVELTLKLRNG